VAGYLIRRLVLMVLTLFGISVIIFVLLRIVPGNIADILFDAAGMVSAAEKHKLETELGLDKPIVVQYVDWIGGLVRVGFRSSALVMRLTRSSMLEVLRQDYIRTARAKGASELAVNYDHALRNAVLPIITIIGIEAAFLVGGLIVTETVFNIPGVARFLVEAIRWRDYPVVQSLVMFIALVVVTVNFLIDMAYVALDPRIKYHE